VTSKKLGGAVKKDSPASLKPSVGLKKVVRAKYPGTRIA
jgi:hypothetical protein